MTTTPTATQWTLAAISSDSERTALKSIFMIQCPKTSSKGTGFLLSNGYLVTNRHVIKDCNATEIRALSSSGNMISFSEIIVDEKRDLAALKPTTNLFGGFDLHIGNDLLIEAQVTTWGYPLWHNDPNPLLSVCYLAGFRESKELGDIGKRLIINGAINGGNSGGPLLHKNRVIGIIVSKWNPVLTEFQKKILNFLRQNKVGVNFDLTTSHGTTKVSESQLVAELLDGFLNTSQVMIGEAICASELKLFFQERKIDI